MSDEIENDTTDEQEESTPTERVTRSSNYPSNTNKERQSAPRVINPRAGQSKSTPPKKEKKVEKIIQGEVIQRKKGIGSKFRDIFTVEDMHSVGNFIVHDVLVPAIKTMLSDAVSQGVERSLFGENRRSSGRAQQRTYTAYSSYSRPGNSSPVGRAGESDGPRMSQRGRATHDFDEIVLENRADADEVLDGLAELIRSYEVATVADLYEMVGVTGSFTDNKWGWTSLAGAGVTRSKGGYLLDLPRPVSIE